MADQAVLVSAEPVKGAAPESAGPMHTDAPHGPKGQGFLALTIGSVGVVFGDIGTSPLYAMREALSHARHTANIEVSVLGVVSLVLWALTLIVTVKYVVFLMRADNKGEGGTLALMALAQSAFSKRSTAIFLLGVVGASLFYGDGMITPAISVLGAIEGLRDAPGLGHTFRPYVVLLSAIILVGVFLVQSRGTQRIASFFGPITAVWLLALAGLGIYHLAGDWSVLRAFSPYYGVRFLFENGFVGFVILGSVFLAVTGAEALYADMGHFGRDPIRFAWLAMTVAMVARTRIGQ